MSEELETLNIHLSKKQKNLKYYQNKVVDFSKRNRLLKYPARASSIEFDVPFEKCADFFGALSDFKCELPHKAILNQDVESQEQIVFSEPKILENSLPKTNFTGKKLIAQLDKLRLQAKNNFDSHGLHTLFVAVGEVSWKEELAGRGSTDAVTEYDYFAPLLLIPVEITNQKNPQKKSVIQLKEELYDIQVNPVLQLFIKQELELRIPKLPTDFSVFNWQEIVDILSEFENIFKEKKLDCKVDTKIRLGQFTFHGQQIYEDLVRNEKQILDHEFISGLCGDSQISQSSDAPLLTDEDNIDNFLTVEEDYTILDADESQLRSIKSVLSGKHMVIHGPPGTGKSQTIANLISNLLARGKKVLFVCEKQVALEVVFNRLKTKGADVSDLCLPLFQYSTDKKNFAKSIIESRNRLIDSMRSVSKNSINEKLIQRKDVIKRLKDYSDALLSVVVPLDKSIYWIHGELARVSTKVEGAAFPWKEKDVSEINFECYEKITHLLNELSGYADLMLDAGNHWSELKQAYFTPDYSSRLFAKLEEFQLHIASFPKLQGTIFGNPKNIREVNKILNFADSTDVRDLLDRRLINSTTFNSSQLKNELIFSEKIKETLNHYDEIAGKDNKYNVLYGWELDKSEYTLLDPGYKFDNLISNRTQVSLLKDLISKLENAILNDKFSKELANLSGEVLKKYKKLFNTDPVVQKIKGWDERVCLYEVVNNLKQILTIYNELLAAQEVLNEWAISLNEIDSKVIWEIEQRFSIKYKTFFRVFNTKYSEDIKLITNWCSAHRPQNYSEYKKILYAAADKLRLQNKFDRLMDVFIEKNTLDSTISNVPLALLIESIENILRYMEFAGIDKLNPEIKLLVSATDNFDEFNLIIGLYENVSDKKVLLNEIVGEDLLNDNILLIDFLKISQLIIQEAERSINVYEKTASLLKDKPITIKDLYEDVDVLNKLKEICDQLVSLNPSKFVGIDNCADLICKQDFISEQQKQINAVIKILDNNNLSKKLFYQNLEALESEIQVWWDWQLKYREIKQALGLLMNNDEIFNKLEVAEMPEFSRHVSYMVSDILGLERWIKYQRLISQLAEHKMSWLVFDILEKNIKNINYGDIFVWSFLNKLLADIYQDDHVLRDFNSVDYSRYIENFKQLEKDVCDVNPYRVILNAVPYIKSAISYGGESERVLIRESQKVQRHLPIRKLVMENAAHLLSIKPCWMMSPLTLSSYIPYGSVKFDVVIFDEASQMKIENAISAISRADQAVIIGDEHQLPPTSFFEVTSSDDEEEADMEDVGYESILQSSIAVLQGAKTELLYHYRSTSDDLIAFSNNFIYDNRLITFPAPKYKSDAVQFEYVENGIFDSGQTRRNRIEALRVADLCIQHVQTSSSSLGVIAFSKVQEEAIRDAILEKIKDLPHLADKLDEVSDKKEAFFIKNLESVQGDERDVIILSIGYGPDQNGNVFNRFGPLNSKGGYRRLNVAVTRAKDKIICVSSMKFHQMNPPETSRGAVLLQKYLEYAENGREVLEASKTLQANKKDADSDFEISVENALENLGYTIHRQVGASGFSIDLAVVSPKNNNEYILGIECDGATYHSSKSARIRDRLRQEILERLGWKIYRVWSQHWITHRQEIISDIVKLINDNQ